MSARLVRPGAARGTRALVLALVVVVLLAAAGVVVAGVVLMRTTGDPHPSPAPHAEQYLDALATGDATGALALSGPDDTSLAVGSTALLRDDVLAGAVARIADARVADVTVFPGDATVDVTFTLAGDTYRETLAYDWDEADDDWVLTRGLAGTLAVTGQRAAPVPFAVTGVRADDDPALCRDGRCGPDGEQLLFPAVYDVSVDLTGWAFDPAENRPTEQEVRVEPRGDAELRFVAEPPAG
ncbi:hypothetical protein ACFUMH_16070 [Cellulomonas sp. NPDC057328]|uniref:hypothetical protein n=1 Tax=Cellulomonas sp. NPDC057328 TaxID=3346101 RepID=UPI00363B6C4E